MSLWALENSSLTEEQVSRNLRIAMNDTNKIDCCPDIYHEYNNTNTNMTNHNFICVDSFFDWVNANYNIFIS